MGENNIIIEENIKPKKMNFFKRFWYSITNFDKYMDMAVQGPYKAFIYVFELAFFMCTLTLLSLGIKYISTQGITIQLTSENIIQFLSSQDMIAKYIASLILFLQYFVVILTYIIILTFIGYITARLIGIRMRYQAIYSIASYAITLSTVLYTCYLIVNIFTIFKVKYMDVAYMAISYIYIITVIFILKSDIIKKHQELMRIMEEQKRVKEEIQERKNEKTKEENKKENKDTKKENSDDEETEEDKLLDDNDTSKEPNGNEV